VTYYLTSDDISKEIKDKMQESFVMSYALTERIHEIDKLEKNSFWKNCGSFFENCLGTKNSDLIKTYTDLGFLRKRNDLSEKTNSRTGTLTEEKRKNINKYYADEKKNEIIAEKDDTIVDYTDERVRDNTDKQSKLNERNRGESELEKLKKSMIEDMSTILDSNYRNHRVENIFSTNNF